MSVCVAPAPTLEGSTLFWHAGHNHRIANTPSPTARRSSEISRKPSEEVNSGVVSGDWPLLAESGSWTFAERHGNLGPPRAGSESRPICPNACSGRGRAMPRHFANEPRVQRLHRGSESRRSLLGAAGYLRSTGSVQHRRQDKGDFVRQRTNETNVDAT